MSTNIFRYPSLPLYVTSLSSSSFVNQRRKLVVERQKGEQDKSRAVKGRKMECCGRANRSDIHLSREEEAKLEEQARQYYDGLAPKRHTKPQRSEYSPAYVDALANNGDNNSIPELAEFQRLENDPQKLVCNGNEVTEEFLETEYYKDLNSIDKQHHTTGTGFISMGNASANHINLAPDSLTTCHASCRGNPATNEWIPAAVDAVAFDSDKPNRSDN